MGNKSSRSIRSGGAFTFVEMSLTLFVVGSLFVGLLFFTGLVAVERAKAKLNNRIEVTEVVVQTGVSNTVPTDATPSSATPATATPANIQID